ncbi:hypothetical protein B0O80DRAFT_426847 [Mortierella sp. GBAus27b]|nr:hypothetical protein BGX31_007943 [Mortierella sp. GBA43]KAI8353440.1 hypothetical protein B0O80DRAFT_426847 [Mortierella sp. GBAus27b]
MKFNTIAIISAVLAIASVAQAGPTETVPVTAVNPNDSNDTFSGDATFQPNEPNQVKGVVNKAKSDLRCWNQKIKGRTHAISCSGSYWHVWTKCSGRYYYSKAFSGSYRVTVTCPRRTSAKAGGAY